MGDVGRCSQKAWKETLMPQWQLLPLRSRKEGWREGGRLWNGLRAVSAACELGWGPCVCIILWDSNKWKRLKELSTLAGLSVAW